MGLRPDLRLCKNQCGLPLLTSMGKKHVWKNFIWYAFAIPLCIAGLFCGVLPFIEKAYQWHYGAGSVYLLTGTGLPIALFLALFLVVCWLFAPGGLKGYFENEDGTGIQAGFSRKKKYAVCAAAVFLTMAATAGSMFWFQRFTMDGTEYRCFFGKKEYGWQEVECLTLKADAQGSLMFVLQMGDGSRRTFNGGLLWSVEYTSEAFGQQFPEDIYGYARWLGRELGSRGVPLQAEGGWEALMEKLKYDSWKMLAEDIREIHSAALLERNG